MDLGGILQNTLDSLFQNMVNTMVSPFVESISNFFLSREAISNLLYVDAIFGSMRVIGMALLILITSWQAFKSMFAWAGFEADEPIRIAVKAVVMGVMIWFAKDIMFFAVDLTGEFVQLVLLSTGQADYHVDFGVVVLDMLANLVGLFVINTILYIYIIFKCIGLMFKIFERYVLCSLLVAGSPLALACGIAQPTKGFLTGFIRVFVGNLLTQLLQFACLAAIMIMQISISANGNSFVHIFIIIGIIKVCGKLEEITRDMSINVGIGREMGGALNKVQSVVHVSQSVVNVAKSFVKG